jgi:hypothetical protein
VVFNRSNAYTYSGVISGPGGVTQVGSGKTTLTGVNTYTGTTSTGSSGGTIALSSTGTIAQSSQVKILTTSAGGAFDITAGNKTIKELSSKGTINLGTRVLTISGKLTLEGGNIHMNLMTPNLKIIATGAASATGTTTLHITSGTVTDVAIIQAASGLNSTTPFALNMPGYTASLKITGTQLLLTASTTDVTPPVPGAGVNGTATDNTANLNWVAATDNVTPQADLCYYVYQSSRNNITSVADCETNGTLLGNTTGVTEYEVTELNSTTTYYFNVVVADMANNKAAYTPKQLTTVIEPKIISVTISPKTTAVKPGNTQQFDVTVQAVGGADESVTWDVIGNGSTLTTISTSGLLTVGSNEIAETLIVVAISTFDPTIFDEATVTVGEVGIEPLQVTSYEVQVYPNPTRGEIVVSTEYRVESIEVFDVMGRLCHVETWRAASLQSEIVLNISHLQNGIFFVRITTEDGVITRKIVKN